jgi:Ca2+-transporting ATPase
MQSDFWHNLTIEEVFRKQKTNESGLTTTEVKKRLTEYGPNELAAEKKVSKITLLFSQLKSPLIAVLIVAVLISLSIGHFIDATVIAAVIIINTMIGFFQEFKAETALETLKSMAAPETKVIRDCSRKIGCLETKIKAKDVVPGDVLFLEAGDKVPADARIFQAINLEMDESMLTGESMPARKTIEPLPANLQVADMANMAFSGTIVVQGRGKAVVIATGCRTEIGKIAELIKETKRVETPMQRRNRDLTRKLGLFALLTSSLVFIIALYRTLDIFDTFLFALAAAVSAIPEGLPAVLTITLAVGVNRMAKRNALIRKLQAVDTLGSATVICTDKTGTLTTNQMTVRKLYLENRYITVSGEGFNPEGKFELKDNLLSITEDKSLNILLKIGALCNDARLASHETEKGITWEIKGDPTEGALVVAAAKAGLNKDKLEEELPRVDEIPFNPQQRYMVTFHQEETGRLEVFVKGAPEAIVPKCQEILLDGSMHMLTEQEKEHLHSVGTQMAREALRILAMASTTIEESELAAFKRDFKQVQNLQFIGLAGMIDPPRQEAKAAVSLCKRAGIRVVMATGDHRLTAETIANEIGISGTSGALTGVDLDEMSADQLDKATAKTSVYARVSPVHKFRIVESLRRQGNIVAMTGDGVNDAPALKAAEIGIAMGITGTDVTKETADMVLTDDNFASIVNAVEEGRVIFENIRKVVKYLVSTTSGEIITILGALILLPNVPLIFTAVQVLWVNLVTDGLLVIPLALEPKEENVMDKPPRRPKENIINRELVWGVVFVGVIMAVGTLSLFIFGLNTGGFVKAQSLAFVAIAYFQVFNALNCRSQRLSFFKVGPFSNRLLLLSVTAGILLQILAVELPFFQTAFGTTGLSVTDLLLVVLVSSSILIGDEIRKGIFHSGTTKSLATKISGNSKS